MMMHGGGMGVDPMPLNGGPGGHAWPRRISTHAWPTYAPYNNYSRDAYLTNTRRPLFRTSGRSTVPEGSARVIVVRCIGRPGIGWHIRRGHGVTAGAAVERHRIDAHAAAMHHHWRRIAKLFGRAFDLLNAVNSDGVANHPDILRAAGGFDDRSVLGLIGTTPETSTTPFSQATEIVSPFKLGVPAS